MPNKLSILIPVYNESQTIQRLLNKLLEIPIEKEIIVVDDGSDDGTSEILGSLSNPHIHVLRHCTNRGKGAAIRTGIEQCSGDIIAIQDADLDQDLNVIYQLVRPILADGAQLVYGSRFLGQIPKMKWQNYFANRLLSRLTSFLYLAKISDVETCFKVFAADVIKAIPLKSNGFEFEVEVTAKVLKRGFKIKEVPIHEEWYKENYHASKKLNWKDGVKAFFTLFRYRFSE